MPFTIMGKTQTRQFEILIEFMERHGDLQIVAPQDRFENLKKWHELVGLLNDSAEQGETKSCEKWRKVWSDFKNNTKKKVKRLKRNGSDRSRITPLEKRVLNLIGYKTKNKEITTLDDERNRQFKVEVDSDSCRSSSSPPERYFASVDDPETILHRKSSSSSRSSQSSEQPRKKRRKSDVTTDGLKDITDRFFQYEREKDRMAHEQQMAQMKQNENILSILGRMVCVFETLAPSIQKYLESNSNGNG